MQGRQGHGGGPMDRPSEPGIPSLNGTSKHRAISQRPSEPGIPSLNGTSAHRAIPQRPPGMVHLDTPPEMTRVPRPQRKPLRPTHVRKLLLILCGVLVVAAIIAGIAGYLIGLGLSSSSGPSVTAVDFLSALNTSNYEQAYKDLGPAITIPVSQQQFTRQAQAMDVCYGPVAKYTEVANSATVQDNIQSYTYTITRSKLSQPYQMRVRLQQDTDDSKWKITDYGNTLGPGQHAPTCSK